MSIDNKYKDIYGVPVANIRIGSHPHDIKVGKFLAKKAEQVLKEMGAKDVSSSIGHTHHQIYKQVAVGLEITLKIRYSIGIVKLMRSKIYL